MSRTESLPFKKQSSLRAASSLSARISVSVAASSTSTGSGPVERRTSTAPLLRTQEYERIKRQTAELVFKRLREKAA